MRILNTELYRSPQAAYIQVEPKLEKLLAHDEKVIAVYINNTTLFLYNAT